MCQTTALTYEFELVLAQRKLEYARDELRDEERLVFREEDVQGTP